MIDMYYVKHVTSDCRDIEEYFLSPTFLVYGNKDHKETVEENLIDSF